MPFRESARYDHAFAILRFDADMAAEFGMKPDYVAVTKVVWTEDRAAREVERLNRLNANKGAVYFWQVARLERRDGAEPERPSHPTAGVEPSPSAASPPA